MDKAVLQPKTLPDGERPPQVIHLARNQKLLISRTQASTSPVLADSEDCVRLVDADGVISLIIRITAGGTMIELGGGPVALNVKGDLAISARKLLLHGQEEVVVSSGADVRIDAQENCVLQAKRQQITAAVGDVEVYANDDVKIDGERIRMNCDSPVRPL